MAISVLYIHHIGTFGGASRSLLEMIRAFPSGSVKAHLITQRGNVVKIFKNQGIPVIDTIGISQFDNTRYGYYRKFRWALLVREFVYLYPTSISILKAKKIWNDIDIVHINEITNLLPIIICKFIFKKPVVVHCRSVQQNKKAKIRYRIINYFVNKYSNRIIAIDNTVRQSLPSKLKIEVIHNGFNLNNNQQKEQENTGEIFNELYRISTGYMKIAMVGNLLKFKGVYEFVKAAKICIDKKLKIIFIFVGASPYNRKTLKSNVLKKIGLHHYINFDITNYIQKNNLNNNFRFVPFTQYIHSIYKIIDVICFPSHLNAVGRPVIEASFYKVPSIVAITDPLDDTMIDGETGLCVQPKNYRAIADAIEYFYSNPHEIKRMGEAAYQLALKNFDINKNAEKMLKIYKNCLQISKI